MAASSSAVQRPWRGVAAAAVWSRVARPQQASASLGHCVRVALAVRCGQSVGRACVWACGSARAGLSAVAVRPAAAVCNCRTITMFYLPAELCWDGTGFGIPDFVGKAAYCEPLPVIALEFLENLRRPPCQRQRPRKQALARHRLQQHQACPPRPNPPWRRHRQTWARLPPQRRARSCSPNRCLDGVKGSAGSRRTENHAGAISSKKRISKFDLTPLLKPFFDRPCEKRDVRLLRRIAEQFGG